MGVAAPFIPYERLIGPMIVLCAMASILMLLTGMFFWVQGQRSGRFYPGLVFLSGGDSWNAACEVRAPAA